MQRKILLTILTLIFAGLIFSSYEHGPAYEGGLNRTGSSGGGANCAGSGCHGANDPSTIVAVLVKNSAGAVVTQYVPGASYTVTITGHNTSTETLSKFGFQVSGIITSSGNQAGTFTAVSGSNIRIVTVSGLQIAEHKKPLDGSGSNTYSATFNWTAPTTGSGPVAFYGILNPVASDGHKTTDDEDDDDDDDDDEPGLSYPNIAPIVTLTQGNGSGSAAVGSASQVQSLVRCFPNPCGDNLNIAMDNAVTVDKVEIYDMAGRLYLQSEQPIHNNGSVKTDALPSGVYTLVVHSGAYVQMMQIVKK